MNDILIRTDNLPRWIDEKYFNGTDLASIEDLIDIIEELKEDLDYLQEQYNDLEQNLNDNYKFIGEKEAVGYNEKW